MIPESIQNLVGKPFGITVFEIEKEPIRRFADAVGETNPLYYDAGYAADSKYGSLIAPPGYLSSPWYWESSAASGSSPDEINGLGDLINKLMEAGYPQTIDSGIDYEFFEPVKAGDVITATSYITNIAERGKGDETAVFMFTETTYTNQDNATVAVSKITTTHR